ncbi:hypothetical protein B0H63DRAFT_92163 [Podospora didyma]|uniref:Uncharacterized protein n=1 Tax=Podospora didyma TaxID=330526 RepID=A0AAE0JYV6_9PEZI|nr:hypothetical protein B0H63DRAFT_92163 [Podospora didyma]
MPSLMGLAALCIAMLAALTSCTVYFLLCMLPQLLAVFLHFQSLDLKLRILQPWAAAPNQDGATASQSLHADYVACAPVQSSIHALRSGDWAVAASSLLSTLFVLIPILAGRTFVAPTSPDGAVRMFSNVVASGVVLALLVLHFLVLLALLAWISPRKSFCAPHLPNTWLACSAAWRTGNGR